MKRDIKYSLFLIILGFFSIWLFCSLGEKDMTGCVLIIILGICYLYDSVRKYSIGRKKNGKYAIDKNNKS